MAIKSINELLSFEDIKRMGPHFNDDVLVHEEFLRNFFEEKSEYRIFMNSYKNEHLRRLEANFPELKELIELMSEYFPQLVIRKKQNGLGFVPLYDGSFIGALVLYFKYSYPQLFDDIDKDVKDQMEDEVAFSDDDFKDIFRTIYRTLNDKKRNLYCFTFSPIIGTKNAGVPQLMSINHDRENQVNKDVKYALYIYKNITRIFEIFQHPVEIPEFELVNYDRFLLLMVAKALYMLDDLANSNDTENAEYNEEKMAALTEFVERYLVLTDYIARENNGEYHCTVKVIDTEFTYEAIRKDIMECLNDPKVMKYRTNIDIAKLFRKYLIDARKKSDKQKVVQAVQVGWEVYKKGKGEKLGIKINRPLVVDEERSQALREKDEQLLEEKLAFYPETDYIYQLDGQDSYLDYYGYVYPNGRVVLDKYYRALKHGYAPARAEGIVVMDIHDFYEMTKYTKVELMELIRDNEAGSAIRKNHADGWQDRINTLITEERDYDLERIDAEVQKIVINQEKNKTKKLVEEQ